MVVLRCRLPVAAATVLLAAALLLLAGATAAAAAATATQLTAESSAGASRGAIDVVPVAATQLTADGTLELGLVSAWRAALQQEGRPVPEQMLTGQNPTLHMNEATNILYLTFFSTVTCYDLGGVCHVVLGICPQGECKLINIVNPAVFADTTSHIDIAINPATQAPVVAICNYENNQLLVMTCSDPLCSAPPSYTKPGIACSAAPINTAFGAAGSGEYLRAVLACADGGGNRLCVVRCADANCTTASAAYLSDPTHATVMGDLALDNQSIPFVAGIDQYGSVSFYSCADPACSSASAHPIHGFVAIDIAVQSVHYPVVAASLYYGGLAVDACQADDCSQTQSSQYSAHSFEKVSLAIATASGTAYAVTNTVGPLEVIYLVSCPAAQCSSPQGGFLALGSAPAITISNQSLPVVALLTSQGLDLLLCHTPTCGPSRSLLLPRLAVLSLPAHGRILVPQLAASLDDAADAVLSWLPLTHDSLPAMLPPGVFDVRFLPDADADADTDRRKPPVFDFGIVSPMDGEMTRHRAAVFV